MIIKRLLLYYFFIGLSLTTTAQVENTSATNTLSKKEKKAGWKLLFDGVSFKNWRGFKGESIPSSWHVEDGAIVMSRIGTNKPEDLLTIKEYKNFELSLEWKISEGGNSGILFYVSADSIYPSSSDTGPEMQVLDNDKHPDGKGEGGLHRAGSAYDLYPASAEVVKPVGEYNQAKLLLYNGHVEHWLNGIKIVQYDLLSPEWEMKVAKSKFAKKLQYGRLGKGHISLQDHNDKVWFRNLKIRELK